MSGSIDDEELVKFIFFANAGAIKLLLNDFGKNASKQMIAKMMEGQSNVMLN
jgi:hypothetical protein